MDDTENKLMSLVKSASFWAYFFSIITVTVLASLALTGWYLHLSAFTWLIPIFILYSFFLTLVFFLILYLFRSMKMSEIKSRNEIKALEKQAHYDSITGLPNRNFFLEALEKFCRTSSENHLLTAVFIVGLDHFKNINDILGHRVGDLLLLATGKRIKDAMRTLDFIARLAGDEFGVIIQLPFKDVIQASYMSDRVIKAFHKPLTVERRILNITVSIGIAIYPMTGNNVETLVSQAGIALYQAKAKGRNNYQIFTKALNKRHLRVANIEQQLKSAIKKNEFYLVYQPIMDLKNHHCVRMEALLRWNNASLGGEVGPSEFINIAENSGSIIEIGNWVFEEACQQLSILQKLYPKLNLQMAINCSVLQLQRNIFVKYIYKTTKRHELLPENLLLEMTESAVMMHVDETLDVLKEIDKIGIQIAIDDFGTGYSSLSYLKLLPISLLKIDKSFVRDIEKDVSDKTIVQMIIRLAKMLGLKVLAEGVETKFQLEFLQENNCDLAQGFYIARPMSSEKLKEFLKRQADENSIH